MMSKPIIVDLEQGWAELVKGFTKLTNIIEGNDTTPFSTEEYMTLYTTVYTMCTQKAPNDYAKELYKRYKDIINVYLASTVLEALERKHDEFLLGEVNYRWENHKIMSKWMSRFFAYLDRFFVVRNGVDNLNVVGIICFRDTVYQNLKEKIKDALVRLIEREREGEQIVRTSLKSTVDMFIQIGIGNTDLFEEDFEKYMLLDTAQYYSRKASIWIVEETCPDYMTKAEDCLEREKDRVFHYLHQSSETKLLEIVQYELLVTYANQLLEKENSGCRALLRDDKVDDLARMYRLFQRIPNGLEPVSTVFKKHVTNEGMVIVQKAEETARNKAESTSASASGSEGHVFVREVIELHDKYMKYVNYCFAGNSIFYHALKEAFEVFCNKMIAGNSSAELLSSYCDYVLKKGGDSKTSSDEVIEDTIEKVVSLLAYVSDKDLFAEFHRKKLARRLLFDRSANDDHERLVLTKLKQQCGGQFTSKMEGMVNDLAMAKEFQSKFENYIEIYPTGTGGVDFCTTVLTTGFWPTYKSSDLRLPIEMVRCVEIFKEFYSDTTAKRKLTWIFSLGSCNINVKCDSRTFELVVGTYQAAALLLFNEFERLSYAEIKEQLNLGDDDVSRVLHSLSCAKYKILKKEPDTRQVSGKDVFEFNSKFTDKMRRIRIPLPQLDEKKKILEVVDTDRRHTIDASLVRIMKSRKVLNHQQLIQECVEQLSHIFKPDIKAIKKRIEDLITRDYLKRDEDQPNLYKYLA